jgi:hypothetical protein
VSVRPVTGHEFAMPEQQRRGRVATGDVNLDGKDDIVMAYQISEGKFDYDVFSAGLTSSGIWYTSGPFNLTPVAGRFVVRSWSVYTPPPPGQQHVERVLRRSSMRSPLPVVAT